jgi:hypothetical protein
MSANDEAANRKAVQILRMVVCEKLVLAVIERIDQ